MTYSGPRPGGPCPKRPFPLVVRGYRTVFVDQKRLESFTWKGPVSRVVTWDRVMCSLKPQTRLAIFNRPTNVRSKQGCSWVHRSENILLFSFMSMLLTKKQYAIMPFSECTRIVSE